MSKQLKKTNKKEVVVNLNKEYKNFLNSVKEQLRVSQIRSALSVRNLRRMRQFSQIYPDFLIRPQVVAELPWGAYFSPSCY